VQVPAGQFVHSPSKTEFNIGLTPTGMVQRLSRNGDTSHYSVAYAIGSGQHAFGFIVRQADHLYQSPLCYYPERGWGMAPGYENSLAPDFFRPVAPECLFCHSGRANPKPATVNSYNDPPILAEGITCERCHGSAEAHLRNPEPGSIINPAKLASRARDSVCEQCHLSGQALILNPGRQIYDFHAGQNLEDVYSIYVFKGSLDASMSNPFKVISHVQQLALSACARKSGGRLWCGTCHNPHEQPAQPIAYFRNRCLSCHGTGLLKTHPKPNEDCIGCHMSRRPVTDGGHTTFTDHRITRVNPAPAEPPSSSTESAVELVPWHEPPSEFAQRNLGLADVAVGRSLKAPDLAIRGARALIEVHSSFPKDAAVLTGIGEVLFDVGRYDDAAAVYEEAIKVQPEVASNYLHAAEAWRGAKNDTKAIHYLEKTIEIDPMIQEAYGELTAIYTAQNETALVRQTWDRFVRVFPGSIEARAQLRRLEGPSRP
jgi:tetratricopeptide (TPR) repeat protein